MGALINALFFVVLWALLIVAMLLWAWTILVYVIVGHTDIRVTVGALIVASAALIVAMLLPTQTYV